MKSVTDKIKPHDFKRVKAEVIDQSAIAGEVSAKVKCIAQHQARQDR